MTKQKSFISLLIALFFAQTILAQVQFGFGEKEIKQRLKEDILVLSSDEFEGREAGTEGERKAAAYIKDRMEEAGLMPMFNGSYLQAFTFSGALTLGSENFLVIGDEEFSLQNDFFIMSNSATERVYAKGVYVGFGMEDENHNDYEFLSDLEDKIFFMEFHLPPAMDTGGTRLPLDALQRKIRTAEEKGALAIILVNSRSDRRDPNTGLNQQLGKENIPVLFAKSDVLEFWQQMEEDEYVFLSADLSRETLTAYNVAGYIDNQADNTIVIGGHFDHLGYGGQGSRSPGAHAIHPGADDNASGTAGVIEAARYLTQSAYNSNNYIFMAFSAEEKGLLGSRHFTQSDAYDMGSVTYMFNFDMIGRMENNEITLYGTGSSPVWDTTIDMYAADKLNVRKSASGVGASDHTNFYRQNIPVLFFFSGLHDDYHRPEDTEDKINYDGMHTILNFAYNMIGALDNAGKLPFTETPVARRGATRAQGPTLGLMPDHAFDGIGLRILAVSENNPAQKAGMVAGDIIVRIGETRVSDIYTYMQAMGTLNASDTISVGIERNGAEMDIDVEL